MYMCNIAITEANSDALCMGCGTKHWRCISVKIIGGTCCFESYLLERLDSLSTFIESIVNVRPKQKIIFRLMFLANPLEC